MDFDYSPKVLEAKARLEAFMDAHVYPQEEDHDTFVDDQNNLWKQWPKLEGLKALAREQGLWNFFLPPEYGEFSAGFHNVEFAPLAEVMGRVPWSFEIFNCSAPDRGNMEVLARFGTPEQQDRWLRPLLDGQIRSCYAMTEPQVASSDATNISLEIEPRRQPLRAERPQVVLVEHLPPALRGAAGDGRVEPRRAPPPAPFDDPGSEGHAGSGGRASDEGVRPVRLARRPR